MLGRPLIAVPVFIIVWAGSWLIWSVTIDRMMAMSSTNFAWYGRKSLIHCPLLPCLLELREVPLHLQLRALELGDRLALRERLGHRLAVEFVELRLVVERLEVARPAGHVQEDDALRLRRVVREARRGRDTSRRRASVATQSSASSATEPRPTPAARGKCGG